MAQNYRNTPTGSWPPRIPILGHFTSKGELKLGNTAKNPSLDCTAGLLGPQYGAEPDQDGQKSLSDC